MEHHDYVSSCCLVECVNLFQGYGFLSSCTLNLLLHASLQLLLCVAEEEGYCYGRFHFKQVEDGSRCIGENVFGCPGKMICSCRYVRELDFCCQMHAAATA